MSRTDIDLRDRYFADMLGILIRHVHPLSIWTPTPACYVLDAEGYRQLQDLIDKVAALGVVPIPREEAA